jgi:GNAT superfamily N-acetyltransferase
MALATWWQGDALPELSRLPGFQVEIGADVDQIAQLTSLERDEVVARLDAGHRIYIASLDSTPTSYGWVATLSSSIGELDLAFSLPEGDRYLWDFATLPEWRGRGLYPRLLQAIISNEVANAQRFWIINAPENAASGKGIGKAGFTPIGELSFLRDRRVGSVAIANDPRSRAGAALLGVAFFEAIQDGRLVSPCWRCVIEQHAIHGAGGCWPEESVRSSADCACVTNASACAI